MNKNVYVSDEDSPIWDRAKHLAGAKGISPLLMQFLKEFIKEQENQQLIEKGYERIELEFSEAPHFIPRKKAFIGKWIVPFSTPFKQYSEHEDAWYYGSLALTAKGNVVVLLWNQDREGVSAVTCKIFKSLDEAAADREANDIARHAIQAIGVPVEELDI